MQQEKRETRFLDDVVVTVDLITVCRMYVLGVENSVHEHDGVAGYFFLRFESLANTYLCRNLHFSKSVRFLDSVFSDAKLSGAPNRPARFSPLSTYSTVHTVSISL